MRSEAGYLNLLSLCERTVGDQERLCGCAGLSEPSLFVFAKYLLHDLAQINIRPCSVAQMIDR